MSPATAALWGTVTVNIGTWLSSVAPLAALGVALGIAFFMTGMHRRVLDLVFELVRDYVRSMFFSSVGARKLGLNQSPRGKHSVARTSGKREKRSKWSSASDSSSGGSAASGASDPASAT